ncbi:MAG: bifunctional helix-turn-helix transcriptional regulator/GNAT family N-acetyltransferase [Terriglobales bacterium]|jgi:DNA-binding MarR family transcriptional regulator|nr:helix-turn-helix domain-containing GNAT family N-acetyltransferase [Terriglobales bacterium]
MASRPATPIEPHIHAVRGFNRFYTRQIGVLREGLLKSPFSLAEVRVLYEIAHRERSTATDLCRELGLDPGYLSRILGKMVKGGLVSKSTAEADGRQSLLALTARGRKTFATLDARQSAEVAAMLRPLAPGGQIRMVQAMHTIEDVLEERSEPRTPYILRSHQPGDLGWVVHRHGVLYAQEYGYDEQFEALVAEIVAKFIQHFDSRRERCWIAERDGEIVGSVFLVKKSKAVAKLRLLLVEPSARGLGIGKRLVDECLRFARQAGYKKMVLWTQSELPTARHIYQAAGFRLVEEKPHRSWGRDDLVSQIWELTL